MGGQSKCENPNSDYRSCPHQQCGMVKKGSYHKHIANRNLPSHVICYLSRYKFGCQTCLQSDPPSPDVVEKFADFMCGKTCDPTNAVYFCPHDKCGTCRYHPKGQTQMPISQSSYYRHRGDGGILILPYLSSFST